MTIEEIAKAIAEINASIAQTIPGQTAQPTTPSTQEPGTTKEDSPSSSFIMPLSPAWWAFWKKFFDKDTFINPFDGTDTFWNYYNLENPWKYWGSTDSKEDKKSEEPVKPEEPAKPEAPATAEPQTQQEEPETQSGESSAAASTGSATPEEVSDMIKLHGSFNPDSSVDLRKLEMYRQAKKQGGDFSDITKNAYKLQYGDTSRYNTEPVKSRRQKGTKSPTAPVTSGAPIYFVRVSAGNYRPAVNADLTSGQQLFVRNPNKVARTVYPFIKIQNAPIRRADLP